MSAMKSYDFDALRPTLSKGQTSPPEVSFVWLRVVLCLIPIALVVFGSLTVHAPTPSCCGPPDCDWGALLTADSVVVGDDAKCGVRPGVAVSTQCSDFINESRAEVCDFVVPQQDNEEHNEACNEPPSPLITSAFAVTSGVVTMVTILTGAFLRRKWNSKTIFVASLLLPLILILAGILFLIINKENVERASEVRKQPERED